MKASIVPQFYCELVSII